MRLLCPKCGRAVNVTRRKCSNRRCGFALTLGNVLRFYARRFLRRVRRSAVTRCPNCHELTPIYSRNCVVCDKPVTVQRAVEQTLAPARRHWRNFLDDFWSPIGWLLLGGYLIGSVALFWWLLPQVNTAPLLSLLYHAAITAVFVAVLALVSLWIVPRPVQAAIAQNTSVPVRVGLVFNALALVLGLHLLIGQWWLQALVLTGVFAVLGVAAFILGRLLWPRAQEVRRVHQESQQPASDPIASQGRKASAE